MATRRTLIALAVWPLLCRLGLAQAQAQPHNLVVIINKDNPNAADLAFVQRAYVGSVKGWPDDNPLLVFDQPDNSPARDQFCSDILGRSAGNVKAIWAQNIFTGKGYPPKVLAGDAEVKRTVAANLHAMGYINRNHLDDSVRAVAR